MEATIVLGTLFHHADLELLDPHGVAPDPSATLRPSRLEMRVKLRQAKPMTQPAATAN
jgi:cytochrome P450